MADQNYLMPDALMETMLNTDPEDVKSAQRVVAGLAKSDEDCLLLLSMLGINQKV